MGWAGFPFSILRISSRHLFALALIFFFLGDWATVQREEAMFLREKRGLGSKSLGFFYTYTFRELEQVFK